MTTPDTLNLTAAPFYEWDTFVHITEEPDMGVFPGMIDSIFCAHDTAEPQTRPSLFTGHTLMPHDNTLTERPSTAAPSWIFIVLTLLTALLCLYYRVRKITLGHLLHSIVDSRAMDRMLRGNNMTRSAQHIPMCLLMVATVSLVINHIAFSNFGSYLLLTAVLVFAYFARNGLMRTFGAIFDSTAAVTNYITNNYLYHLVLATVALPLLFLYFYLPDGRNTALYILAAVGVLEFLMRVVRGLKVFLTNSSSAHFYLFYYLCIVEIVPILVLIKYFNS